MNVYAGGDFSGGNGEEIKKPDDNTKCMVEVNGVTLIERALGILDRKELSQ